MERMEQMEERMEERMGERMENSGILMEQTRN